VVTPTTKVIKESKMKHIHISVYSKGDQPGDHWKDILKRLDEGYVIVSTAADGIAIHYILKPPKRQPDAL